MLVFRDITKRRDIENGLEKNLKELEIIKKSANEASEFAESIINTVREPLLLWIKISGWSRLVVPSMNSSK